MSNSGRKASSFAETIGFDAELRMHVTFTRIASRDARHHDRHLTQACASDRGRRARKSDENLCFRELIWAIWSLLPGGGGVLARRRLVRFSQTWSGLILLR
jgi:hypothetical protein